MHNDVVALVGRLRPN